METTLRAKMVCNSLKVHMGPGDKPAAEEIELTAVTADSPENKTWSQYTPSGSVRLYVTNPAAFGVVKPGAVFYVDLVPVEPAAGT